MKRLPIIVVKGFLVSPAGGLLLKGNYYILKNQFKIKAINIAE